MDQKRKPFHETVAENLIRQLEAGTAPWQRPWDAGASGYFLPYNPTTGNRYKGINALHLMAQDRDDQRWMTYRQASDAGGQVRKGQKGTSIQYWFSLGREEPGIHFTPTTQPIISVNVFITFCNRGGGPIRLFKALAAHIGQIRRKNPIMCCPRPT